MFDADEYKRANRDQWEATAQAWHDWMPLVSKWLNEATGLMLDMTGISSGHRVLDLAAGDGEQSVEAARRVGPTGYVLATDIAPNFVALADQVAKDAGFAQLEARLMDAENLDLPDASFDAVISRLGLMYFPNLQRALEETLRVLRPGGHISTIVFTTAQRSPFFSIPTTIIRRRAKLPAPAPGEPGPFSLGNPDVLAQHLRAVGFEDVEYRVISAPLRMASAAECRGWRQETSGTLQQMLIGVVEEERQMIWAEVEEEFRRFEGPEGFESPCELLVCSGTKATKTVQ